MYTLQHTQDLLLTHTHARTHMHAHTHAHPATYSGFTPYSHTHACTPCNILRIYSLHDRLSGKASIFIAIEILCGAINKLKTTVLKNQFQKNFD